MDLTKYSFLDVTVVDRNMLFFIAVEDEYVEENPDHSVILQLHQGNWKKLDVSEKLVSCTLSTYPTRQMVCVAENGMSASLGGGKLTLECIALGADSPSSNGPLVEVRSVCRGKAWAVGTSRQAYRKEDIGNWLRMDQTSKSSDPQERANSCFHSIDGFSESEIYCVGWEGEIWRFDGMSWSQCLSPTNLTLYKVRCCSDGYVYACGQLGTIIRGRGDSWGIIQQEETEEHLRSLAFFKGKLYLVSSNLAYELSGKKFVQLRDDFTATTCGELDANEDVLISVGLKDIMLFDGQNWQKLT